ncbi:MAG: 3-deoxy-7-phosphoheptulonate synthase [Verrucomicrobiota bacterium]|nr:3-deoxy-7-phosphoheptulonate synthase [Verrucomicrobiota bacterium]
MDETQHNTDDIRIDEIRQLLPPSLLLSELPILESSAQLINSTRSDIDNVLNGLSDKLLVVVGPCSIHDQKAAIEYADHVRKWISKYSNDLLIVMRVYFEKPRTTVGWKGLINDPSLDNSFDINNGLKIARSLLSEINEMGVPAGTEFLDAISPQYYADLISWGAIGARTTESQIHRELASGLSMPIGFKNGTGGSIKIAVDGIKAASQPHHFLSVTKQGVSGIVKTRGNKSCHIILRGSSNGPNCDSDSINETSKLLKDNDLPGQLMVDCSHGNSLKDYKRQVSVAENLSEQISNGSKDIASVMIESNLVEGNQKISSNLSDLVYGQSVTDSCVGLEDTEKILSMFADAVQKRRQ